MAQNMTIIALFSRLWWDKLRLYVWLFEHVWHLFMLPSLDRVSMLLHVLRWSYGKVLLLPSCSVVQPCPCSSLKTWALSDSLNLGRNIHTQLHHRRRRRRNPHPEPHRRHPRHPQRSQQCCPGRRAIFVAESARRTTWTPSCQSVRQTVIFSLPRLVWDKVSCERVAGVQTETSAVYRAGSYVSQQPAVN